MAGNEDFTVRFWGVRGSIASPGPETLRYGANTACVELRCGAHRVICDAGTGLRPLGQALIAEDQPIEADLLCSHTHVDHICGFPFFAPIYVPGNRFRVWAGHAAAHGDIAGAFRLMMTPPLFPDVMDTLEAAVEFKNFTAGETLALQPGLQVRTAALNHPGGATAYRIEWAGKSLAYTTDTEHRAEGPDAAVLALAAGVDVMIYDANYTDEDYPHHRGWGHSTWQEGVKLARSAGVRRLVLFHHDPARTDSMLDDIARAASAAFSGTVVAREGLTLTL